MSQSFDVFAAPLDGITLIEASAGTGKTWTLCGLYLRLLLEQRREVPQILVVTFTTAATAELRERIRNRLADTLAGLRRGGGDDFVRRLLQAVRTRTDEDDAALARRLDQALQTFDEASIFTIHGFCQRALADTPFSTGAPLVQELLADDDDLRLQVVQDFWRRRVAGASLPAGLAASLLAHQDGPEPWAQLLKRRVAKPLSLLRWPEGMAAAAPDTATLEQAFETLRVLWQRERDAIVAIVYEALPRLNGGTYKAATVATAIRNWDQWLGAGQVLALPRLKDSKLDLLTTTRMQPKKGQAAPQPHAFFAQADALLRAIDDLATPLALQRLALLRELVDEGPAQLRALKREQRVVGFDDLLLDLHARLSGAEGPRLAAVLRQRFPAALIDEFQDTDPLQFAIVQSLYGDGRAPLCLVGDPKQAIYSFRNADLHTYLQARQHARVTCTLAENQRSTPALLGGLNALFSANPRAFLLPGLDYEPVAVGAKPRPELVDRSAPRAALQLWQLGTAEDGAPLPKAQALDAAVQACADEIARLLGAAQQGLVTLDGRPLAGGDIAVLARTHKQGATMRQALSARGIGSVELSQASVHASADAEQLEQVLAAVLQPARTALLRAALATELMGRDAGTLQALADDEAALTALMARFAGYRDLWLQRGVGPMLRSWMQAEQVNQRLLARPDGERRLTNLLHLAERLQEAAATHAAPEALWRWLQQQRRHAGTDDATQLRLESDRGLVQIVTIHKSKGLEYPIVFCPWLFEGPVTPPARRVDGIEHHDDDGRPVLDFAASAQDPAIKATLARDRLAEVLRLSYVALTRAVHRCVLVVGLYRAGSGRNTAQASRSALNWLAAGAGVDPSALLADGLPADRIGPAWARLADAAPESVSLQPLPAPAAQPLRLAAPPAATLQALPPPRQLPAAWWIGSYSSLVQGLNHEAAALDHDQLLPPGDGPDAGDDRSDDPDDILQFPRGPAAGECLHAVFERAEFDDPASWPAAIAAALREHPQPAAEGDDATRHARQLHGLLDQVLHTPLPGGLQLAALPRTRRLVELEFNLPVGRLGAADLGRLLHAHGQSLPPLAFGTLQGFLRGFIDLVYEYQGRWFIVDWKSNHLGHRSADYAAPSLARAMEAHGYGLQALLYTLALHRYLGRRLPGYRYDTHIGGAMMLFVRGLRPGWLQPDGSPCGVHAVRPPAALVHALSELIA